MIVLQKHTKRLSLKLTWATVNVLVDRLEGLKVVVDHLLSSAIFHEKLTAEDNQSLLRSLAVISQLAECWLNSWLDGVLSLCALDLCGLTEFFLELTRDQLDVLARGDVDRHEWGAIAWCLVKFSDQLLYLPQFNVPIFSLFCKCLHCYFIFVY